MKFSLVVRNPEGGFTGIDTPAEFEVIPRIGETLALTGIDITAKVIDVIHLTPGLKSPALVYVVLDRAPQRGS